MALAAQVLHERGAENPRDHILIYEGPPISVGATTATVLVSAEPFDQATIDAIAAAADDLEFRPVLTPDEASSDRWAALMATGGPGPAVDGFAADMLVLLAAFGMAAPGVVDDMAGATTPSRIAVAVGLLAPLALLMGMPFSIGMRAAASDPSSPTAFLWGINGAVSVVASVFATVLALFFGITMTFLAGVAAYVLAGAALWRIVRALPRSWTPAGQAMPGADGAGEPGGPVEPTDSDEVVAGTADGGDGTGELVGAAEGGDT